MSPFFSRIVYASPYYPVVSPRFVRLGLFDRAWFKLPDETRLVVNERPASFDQGLVRSRPFSWGAAGGIPYRLVDRQSMTVKSGKLRSRFRVASIFWPPVGIAYWPMGYGQRCYDLTGDEPSTCTYEDYRQLRLAERMRR
jgi:hypothetical protein